MKVVLVLFVISLANGDRSSWTKSAPKKELYENVGPPPKPVPVFLSPFTSDGLSDPVTGLKAPVDFLALKMVHPKTEEERRRILKTMPLSKIQFIEKPTPPPLYYNPRDRIIADMQNGTKETPEQMWYNYESLQNMNLNRRPRGKEHRYKYQTFRAKLPSEDRPHQKFQDDKMNDPNESRTLNWTTCEEFKKKAKFHPKDLLDIDWLPFYTWSDRQENIAVIHKFSIPPRKMVVKMKQVLGSRLTHNVDWNQPKLLMENDDKFLLIAADQTGLFYTIRDQPLPIYFKRNLHLKFPVMTYRFKMVGKYLAMMFCDAYYANIMAEEANAPNTDLLKEKAAKALKFTGTGQPVSRDLERERKYAETRKALQQAKEDAKFIVLRDEDYVVEKDRHMDLWA